MMKVFISQPMNGKTEKQILDERRDALNVAKAYFEQDVKALDSIFKDEASPLKGLAKNIALMAKAEAVVFAKGWQDYRGCRIEHACALEYGVKILEL